MQLVPYDPFQTSKILEKKQKGAIIRSVENPIGNARRDPQSFDAGTRTPEDEQHQHQRMNKEYDRSK